MLTGNGKEVTAKQLKKNGSGIHAKKKAKQNLKL